MYSKFHFNKVKNFLIIMSIVILSGCDSKVTTFDYDVSWTTDNPSPGSNSVILLSVLSDPDELRLAVDLYDVINGPTHGIYFDLVFRDEVLNYNGFEIGELLEEVGPVNYQAALDPLDPGRLIVGISLTGDLSLENADGAVVFIRFKPSRAGTCPVTFENARIMTAENGGTRPVTGVAWYGGYATVLH